LFAAISLVIPGTPFAQEPGQPVEDCPDTNDTGERPEASPGRNAPAAGDSTKASEGFVARVVHLIEHHELMERLEEGYHNFSPAFGGMSTGSGIALGVRYGDESLLGSSEGEWSTTWSTKGYQQYEASLEAAPWKRIPLALRVESRYRNYDEEDYFGYGPSSNREDESNYRLEDFHARAEASVFPLSSMKIFTGMGYLKTRTASGTADDMPPLDEIFPGEEAPWGFSEAIRFVTTDAGIEIDRTDCPGYPREGLKASLASTFYRDQNGSLYDFKEMKGQIQGYVPAGAMGGVAALRIGFTDTRAREGSGIPFHMAPYAGGSESVRGYREYRFRDAKLLLANFEYRRDITRGIEAAAFFDLGQVGTHWDDFRIDDFRQSFGAGLRVHTDDSVFLRIDVGHSKEGTRIFFKTGAVFE
jgi:outer membrane protein assembly factor BamA